MSHIAFDGTPDPGLSVPTGWTVRRLKTVLLEPLKYGANEAADSDDPDDPRFVRITDIAEDGSLKPDTFRSLPMSIAQPYLLDEGDLLLARSGATVGKSFMYSQSWGPCCFAGYLIRARPNMEEVLPQYLRYFCESKLYWQHISSEQIQATIQNVSADRYGNLPVPMPSLVEQRAVVEFLDRETAKIDALIAKQEQLIATLREDRTATITSAVTQGLDGRVAKTNSGVEWLGDMPRHWVASRLKHPIESTESGTSVNAGDWPAGAVEVGVLKTSCVSAGWFNPAANKTVVDQFEIDRATCPVKGESLIVNRANTPQLVGSAGYVEADYNNLFLSDKLWQIRFGGASAQFIYYWTQTKIYRSQIAALCVGASSSMQNLAMSDFRNIALALPPMDEQLAIVEFLQDLTSKIDELIMKSTAVIEVLKEYRSALITDAVTGKIDVRGVG